MIEVATQESNRVAKHRKENFDRVSVLIEKGGKHLLRVLALREGVSIAEMIRRAVLARGGLRIVPYPAELKKLETVTTQEEARRAVYDLQEQEEYTEVIRQVSEILGGEPAQAEYTTVMLPSDVSAFRHAVQRIEAAIQTAGNGEPPDNDPAITVKLYGDEIGIMRRMLANIELTKMPAQVDEDDIDTLIDQWETGKKNG